MLYTRPKRAAVAEMFLEGIGEIAGEENEIGEAIADGASNRPLEQWHAIYRDQPLGHIIQAKTASLAACQDNDLHACSSQIALAARRTASSEVIDGFQPSVVI